MSRTTQRIWAAPFFIAIVSIAGLMSALLGEAMAWKAIAWAFLTIPVLTALWFAGIKRLISRVGR